MMVAGLLSPTLAVWPSGRRLGVFLCVGQSGDGEVSTVAGSGDSEGRAQAKRCDG
jgi:hypothetical protein